MWVRAELYCCGSEFKIRNTGCSRLRAQAVVAALEWPLSGIMGSLGREVLLELRDGSVIKNGAVAEGTGALAE